MPANRGAHPEDPAQFGTDQHARLRAAVRDLAWLRSRGYGGKGTQHLVGNRYQLQRRQRDAVARSACSDAQRAHRLRIRRSPEAVDGEEVHIDAFNVLITVEAMLGRAYLIVGRDSAYRDIDPVQGTYRIAHQTTPALHRLAETLHALNVASGVWHLDRSVSNVGRVKECLAAVSSERGQSWRLVEETDVDEALCAVSAPIVTSDSAILDASGAWLPLEAMVHAQHIPDANVVDLRPDGERASWPPVCEASRD